ncbi:MAG TPA: TonB family protein [Bryobacteraceae bacterium]|nr:TonB family protein [Bryobacteraceae bacterium]
MPAIYEFSLRVLAQLADVSIRSLIIASLALVAILITRQPSAAARHAVWTAILAAMLALPFLSLLLPPVRMKIPAALERPRAAVETSLRGRAAQTRNTPATPPSAPAPSRWPVSLAALYLAVAAAFLARLIAGFAMSRRLAGRCQIVCDPRALNLLENLAASHSTPWPLAQLRASNAIKVPMTLGRRQPVILLPADWPQWDEWKLRIVLAHELAHIRRADWSIALAASLNRCLFWFHPLAWWLERHLAALAEQASDDAALACTGDAPRYARVILEFASLIGSTGRRLAIESVAMARTPHVSRRIDRILAARISSPGILTRSTWIAIAACALPLVYSAAALQLSQSAPRPAPNPGLARLLTEGSQLSAAEAQQLEQHLATQPDDVATRARLASYHIHIANEGQARDEIFWLVEHRPESEVALYFSRTYQPPAIDYERLKALWLQQVTAHPGDPRVLANAAAFLGDKDQFAEEDLLKRARQVDPQNPEWTTRLADLMSGSIARWFLSKEWNYVPSTEPAFAEAARTELENSTDAPLIGAVGQFLGSASPGGRPPAQKQTDYAAFLLHRAQSLDPDNAEWSAAIQRLQSAREHPFAPPATQPSKDPVRIRVGAVIQQSNRLHSVDPVYPALAQQARIQGVVRFNILIGKDGRVTNVSLISGHPLLVPAAEEAVKAWVYRPTLLNGNPVEVATVVDINFTLADRN